MSIKRIKGDYGIPKKNIEVEGKWAQKKRRARKKNKKNNKK